MVVWGFFGFFVVVVLFFWEWGKLVTGFGFVGVFFGRRERLGLWKFCGHFSYLSNPLRFVRIFCSCNLCTHELTSFFMDSGKDPSPSVLFFPCV